MFEKKTINGLVNDSNGEPLPGVTIVVKGTTTGTVSNIDGNFTLEIPTNAEIISFSFIGFQNFILPVNK